MPQKIHILKFMKKYSSTILDLKSNSPNGETRLMPYNLYDVFVKYLSNIHTIINVIFNVREDFFDEFISFCFGVK